MLNLSLGGTVSISGNEAHSLAVELVFPTQKAHALFVYLSFTQGRSHSRQALATFFWPDSTTAKAASNLRQTLHRIRTVLVEAGINPEIIHTGAHHIALTASNEVVIDLLQIDQVWKACQAHPHRSPERCTICARRLADVAERITETPLERVTLTESPEFELWLTGWRAHIIETSGQILRTLAKFHAVGGEIVAALGYVRQWLMLEPWQEEAHALAIELLAAQGKRTAALHQFQQCRQVLHEQLGVEPAIELQRLYDQIAKGSEPLLSRPSLRHAPFTAIQLFGRQTEWKMLEKLINNPANRLITLLGPGGVGKTQLALEAGHTLARLFEDGAYYVGVDGVSDEGQFYARLASGLGIALGTGPSGSPAMGLIKSQVLNYLAYRNLLILLDGMEQLTHIASFLATLLVQAPSVTLLVTSRARLELRAEQILALQGLAVPVSLIERRDDADDSLAHFVHAAQRLAPGFQLTPEHADDVLRICKLLEGLPLAIELAAAQIVDTSLQRLATELARNFDRLAANWSDMPPRQRSLRASFDASWDHLPTHLQQLLSLLAVFAETFSAEAIAALGAAVLDAPPAAARLQEDLQKLVNFSLLHRTINGRYTLHSSVRAFAREQLEISERLSIAYDAHLRYYSRWLQEHHPSHAGEAQKDYLDQIAEETSNLWGAWHWAEATENWAMLNPIVEAAHAACAIRGLHEECAQMLDQSINAMDIPKASGAAAWGISNAMISQTFAHLSILRGLTALEMSDCQLAHTHAAQTWRCIQSIDDGPLSPRRRLEAAYWLLECKISLYESNWKKMEADAQRGMEALPPTGEIHLQSEILNYVGVAAQAQGQFKKSLAALEQSMLLINCSDGDYWQVAKRRGNLAVVLIFEQRIEEAVRLLWESFTYFHHIGDPVYTALTLDHLAYIEMAFNNNAKAATDLCSQALALLEQTGLPSRKAEILSSLGIIALKEHNPQAAYTHSVKALSIALDISRTVDIVTIGAWLSIALLHLGHLVAPATQFLCTALHSPLMQADIRQIIEAAMEDLPEPCGVVQHMLKPDLEVDWHQAATALLAPLLS